MIEVRLSGACLALALREGHTLCDYAERLSVEAGLPEDVTLDGAECRHWSSDGWTLILRFDDGEDEERTIEPVLSVDYAKD